MTPRKSHSELKSPRAGARKVATQSVAAVVKRGDRRESLEASPMVIAQIAGRLAAVLKELADLPVAEKVSKADDLAAKRKARRAAAKSAAPATGTGE